MLREGLVQEVPHPTEEVQRFECWVEEWRVIAKIGQKQGSMQMLVDQFIVGNVVG